MIFNKRLVKMFNSLLFSPSKEFKNIPYNNSTTQVFSTFNTVMSDNYE